MSDNTKVVVRLDDLLKAIIAASRQPRPEPVTVEPVEQGTPEFVWTILSRFDSLESAVRDAESAAKSVLRCMSALPPASKAPAEPKVKAVARAVESEPAAYDPGEWRSDAPKELVRRQLEVCAREIGLEAMAERFDGMGLDSLRRMLRGGPTVPRVDVSELDRLYVLVRMAQFDLEHDDEEVEEVRQLIRKREKEELRHKAEGQRA